MGDYQVGSSGQIRYFRSKILAWGVCHFRDFPWRFCNNRWHCLVAEVMLQRTRAEQVLPVFREFAEKYAHPALYLADPLANVFLRLGLSQRDERFRALASAVALHGLPDTEARLLQLPCVGDYIASAFLSLHLGIRAPLIDSNIVRAYGRFFGFETDPETRRKRWLRQLAEEVTPRRKHREYNYALIDFSRDICKHRPDCGNCPVRRQCRCSCQGERG